MDTSQADHESIQGWLKKKGFSVDELRKMFIADNRDVQFSFDELAMHTRSTFKQKAVAHGWVTAEEARK